MKFAKVLQQSQEELPELNSMFLRYKELKKQLKSIPQREQSADPARAPSPAGNDPAGSHHDQDTEGKQGGQLSSEELRFINTLNEDLGKFNRFFMEQEEAAVIQLQALTDELDAQQGSATSLQLKERLVQFHGSCIMLMHWSLLNYAAVAKILKKHDKRTGLLLRAPYLSNVLQQPFNSTSVMSRLVKSAEQQLQKVTPQTPTCKETSAHQQLQQQLLEQQRHVQQHALHFCTQAPTHTQRGQPSQLQAPQATAATRTVAPSCFSGAAYQATPLATGVGASEGGATAPSTSSAAAAAVAAPGAPPSTKHSGTSACTQQLGASGAEAGEGPSGAKSVSVSPQESSLTSLASQDLQQGGIGCQALRALEMWKTLQATASTPSTVVPESSQPVGCSHTNSQSHRTSEQGDDDGKRCGKRARDEEGSFHHAFSPNKRHISQEREVHV